MANHAQHCWHVTEFLLTDPPQAKETCCWCGLRQVVCRDADRYGVHGNKVTLSGLMATRGNQPMYQETYTTEKTAE